MPTRLRVTTQYMRRGVMHVSYRPTGMACMTHVRRYTLLQWIAQTNGSDTYKQFGGKMTTNEENMFRLLFTQMFETKGLHTRGVNG